ncbi:hypothetical protein PF005_g31089 [Phytophthora fragariae]|uniref:Myb-like domain-containing protein n=1 Tax=Phytophthora fragariae TaxID=53985 RepID=A0A6A3YED9_9STRA|nr:hypothetical protein PF005_g31089 [Phytophthora fragariae]KAE9217242.1 hypothetical protein PF002_g16852 [Phytophthora fragariae]KAE9265436.1 hypothetical protein PF001_g30889 [Phytophthora fragariae]
MPQTTFLEEEDKMLVQQARRYTDRGERIAWGQVQKKMRRWGRTSKELSQRLNSLKKTYGTNLAVFPPSVSTPVRAVRGRRSIVVRTVRMPNLLHPNQALNIPATTQQDASGEIQRQAHAVPPSANQQLAARLPATSNPNHAPHLLPGCDVNFGSEHKLPTVIPVSVALLTASDAARAVETIFDGVTRSTVVYPAASPSLNAGELLPSGKPTFVQVLESRFERNLSRLAWKR